MYAPPAPSCLAAGRLCAGLCLVLLVAAYATPAEAQPQGPVLVEYTAPTPDCPSAPAFHRLLEVEVARSPDPPRSWRFSVVIRRIADVYEGTLITETGLRTVMADRCDDVTSSLALIAAMADPSPVDETPPAAAAPPPAPVIVVPAPPPPTPTEPDTRDSTPAPPDAAPFEWRVGARALTSDHGPDSPMLGWSAFGSVELPWGFRKMMFEVGGGSYSTMYSGVGPVSSPSSPLTYTVLDTQACLIDLPLGDSGLSFLGCLRLAGASFKTTWSPSLAPGANSAVIRHESGGALWTGPGARLRWQTPIRLFLEVNVDAVYGTVSGGESVHPGWLDLGASLGARL